MTQEDSNKEYAKTRSGGTWVVCSLIVVIALVLHFFFSRGKTYTMPYRLTQIDSVMQTDPQKAMVMLTEDGKYIDDAPEEISMFYKLLLSTNNDLLGLPQKSDSTMMKVANYYESYRADDKLVRTYYIIARINDRNGNAPRALSYYQKAADKAGRTDMYKAMADARKHSIELILKGNIPSDSLPAYIKAYEKKVEQLYSEHNTLQKDIRIQALAITVCVIIMIVLAVVLLHGDNDSNPKTSADNDSGDTASKQSTLKQTVSDTQLINFPTCNEIKKYASLPDFKLSEAMCKELFSEVDSQYAGLCTRLREQHPRISDIELAVCCLTRLGIRNSDMAHLLCRSDNSISSIRSRLYEKITGVKGSSRLFDELILNF